MDKLYDRIDWENNTTPALNEDNLNAMSKGIDDIDDRVLSLGSAVLEVIPDLEEMLSHAQELKQYRDDAVAAATSAEADEEDASAYAVGERGGVPVGPTDPAYHNNAKYYAQQANPTSIANLTDVDITNISDGQILKWSAADQEFVNANEGGAITVDAEDVNYDNTTSGLTATDVQDAIDEVDGHVGTLSNLTTTAKTSAVAAINEVNGKQTYTTPVTALTGATSATIQNAAIHTTSLIFPTADNGTNTMMAPPTVTVTEGQAVLGFDALEQDTSFTLVVINP